MEVIVELQSLSYKKLIEINTWLSGDNIHTIGLMLSFILLAVNGEPIDTSFVVISTGQK